MAEFIDGQLDYLFFFFGLTLIMIGTASLSLSRRKNGILPWPWMSGFALLLGIDSWLLSLSAVFSDSPLFSTFRAALSASALFSFAVFGFVGIHRARGAKLGHRGKLVGLIAAVALSVAALRDLDLALRYLAFIGSLLASAAFYFTSRRVDPFARRWLYVGCIALLIFAGISIATPELWKLSFENLGSIASVRDGGLLVLAILCIPANFAAAAGWAYSQMPYETDMRSWERSLAFKPALLTSASLIVIVAFGWLGTNLVAYWGDQQARRNLLSRTLTAVSAIDTEAAKKLSGSASDAGKPHFEKIKRQLAKIHAANSDSRFVYLMGMKGGGVVFLADAEPEGSKDYSPPGQPY